MTVKYMELINEVKMPAIGIGTYKTGSDEETAHAVKFAIEAGYRHIDAAAFYGNEIGVGKGIKESGVKREDIFLVTKLWNDDHGYDKTMEAFNKSLERLQVEYLDLYLIHWPTKLNSETWRAFEELYESGKVRAIGVCNFKEGHLEELKESAKIMPMVNQMEVHPFNTRKKLREYCKVNNIQMVAWSPISRGRVLTNELLIKLSEKYSKTITQVVLKWHIQNGVVPIPKSSNEGRIKENFEVFDFEIAKEDMELIASLNEDKSVTAGPDNTTFWDFK
ncbi:aldo/keto reductase [Clostridium culturomicium]|uniref:aldo/keto reductase n=1 Tax=Clostridium culturomicium TaxID=1499683 RepID=UPI00058DA777|nr:aldo/keto reductase [Clostridium culturomicium]